MSLEESFHVGLCPAFLAAVAEKHISNIAAGDEPDWHRHIRCAMGDCGWYFDCDDPAQMVVDRKLDRAMAALRAAASLSGCSRKDLEALVAHQLTSECCRDRAKKRVSTEYHDAIFAVVKCPYCVAAGDSPANAPVDDCPDAPADYFISAAAYDTCTDLLEGDALAEFEEMWAGCEFADASTGRVVIDPATAWWVYKALGAGPDMRARVVEFLRYLCQAGALGMTIRKFPSGGANQVLYIPEPGVPPLTAANRHLAKFRGLDQDDVLVACHHPDDFVTQSRAKRATPHSPYHYADGEYDVELPSTYDPADPDSFEALCHGTHVWVTVPRPGGRWSVFYVRDWDWPEGAVHSASA